MTTYHTHINTSSHGYHSILREFTGNANISKIGLSKISTTCKSMFSTTLQSLISKTYVLSDFDNFQKLKDLDNWSKYMISITLESLR